MTTSSKNNPLLSVIILNYNTGDYLSKCLQSINLSDYPNYQVIVVDNNSADESISLAKQVASSKTKFILSKINTGFSKGNNLGVKQMAPETDYVLFLNPDTIVAKDTFSKAISFFQKNQKVSAATCKVILSRTNQIQPECHRGFPTPWRAFCHFSGLSKIFPKSNFFNGYFQGNFNQSIAQPIEVCMGSFLMVKKEAGDKIGWWNEKFFFYGEDIDFCYKLRQNNFQLWYFPDTSIIHYHGISSGLKKTKTSASKETILRSSIASAEAMRIFYQENFTNKYPKIVYLIVMIGIKLLESIRVFKAKYL